MSDETTLLPCPFCGGEADIYEGDYGNGIYCMMCGAMVGEPIHEEYRITERVSYEQAAKAWNARAERTCKDVKPKLSYFKCDSCSMEDMGGHEIWIRDGFYRSQKPNYCPNCGAKVIGG